MSVYGKLAKIKVELGKREIKKSGHNKFAGFKYHELADFLPHINELNEQYGIDDTIEITQDGCHLTLTDVEDGSCKTVTITYDEAEMLAAGGKPSKIDAIQRLGATVTYIRRYLYMTGYNITENDIVDASDQNSSEPKPVSYATESQVNNIMELVGSDLDKGQKILAHYKVKQYSELTLNQASQCLKQLKK